MLYGAHRGLHGDAAAGRTVAAMAALLPIAGGLAIPVTMGFASLVGYSTSAPIVAVEAAIVGGFLAAATVLARRWALRPILIRRHRRPRRHHSRSPESCPPTTVALSPRNLARATLARRALVDQPSGDGSGWVVSRSVSGVLMLMVAG